MTGFFVMLSGLILLILLFIIDKCIIYLSCAYKYGVNGLEIQSQTKYNALADFLRDEILMGNIKPGDRIPSENELAEKFSMSRHTVRKAISVLVSEGYLAARHGQGTYCVDRRPGRARSGNIGVITTYISEYIFPRIIQGIDRVLSENGYSIILKNTGNDTGMEAVCLKDILTKNIEGLIVEPTKSVLYSNNIRYYQALDSHRIPYIFIHGYYQQLENKSYILLDDAKGMYDAVGYLAGLGHRKIVGIFKADDIQGINRHKGYARALNDAGLAYDPDNVIWFHTEDRETKPSQAVRHMIETGREIDAIACYNDQVAVRILKQLYDLGIRVPHDISVTGFDDSFLSENSPVELTTVAHPKEKLGALAAQILLQMLKDDDYLKKPVHEILIPKLVVKGSCMKR